jgi:hypothetical protein
VRVINKVLKDSLGAPAIEALPEEKENMPAQPNRTATPGRLHSLINDALCLCVRSFPLRLMLTRTFFCLLF